MTDLRAGDTVQFAVEAEVVCVYDSGRVKVRWHSGEETVLQSDQRFENND